MNLRPFKKDLITAQKMKLDLLENELNDFFVKHDLIEAIFFNGGISDNLKEAHQKLLAKVVAARKRYKEIKQEKRKGVVS
jgi:hypothetical protein